MLRQAVQAGQGCHGHRDGEDWGAPRTSACRRVKILVQPCQLLASLNIDARCARRLIVQRLSVPDAAAHELWPGWDGDLRIDLLGQQGPQRGVMPAEIVSRGVSMLPDP